jgi:integrase
MQGRITKRLLDSLKPSARRQVVWDSRTRGFGVMVTPAGSISYVFQYWAAGRARRVTIGRHGSPYTPDLARDEAEKLRALVAAGQDPAGERLRLRRATTISELAELYLDRHAVPNKKPASVESDRRLLSLHIVPSLGRMRVEAVTRADVARLHIELSTKRVRRRTNARAAEPNADASAAETRRSISTGGPVLANRALALLSKMLNLAEVWGIRADGSNPCRNVQRARERHRGRLLAPEELTRLGASLREAERNGVGWPRHGPVPPGEIAAPPVAVSVLRFLLLSGCRKGEALSLRWTWVDSAHSRLLLPDSKTGQKTVPLGAAAMTVITSMPRISDLVFPGFSGSSGQLLGLTRIWFRIRQQAGLPDLRIHDLRHAFASVGASGGETLTIVGALLGHSVPATTARYQHLASQPLRAAADRISNALVEAMKPQLPESQGRVSSLHPLGISRRYRKRASRSRKPK